VHGAIPFPINAPHSRLNKSIEGDLVEICRGLKIRNYDYYHAYEQRGLATNQAVGSSNLSGRAILLFKSIDYSALLGRFSRGCPIKLNLSIYWTLSIIL